MHPSIHLYIHTYICTYIPPTSLFNPCLDKPLSTMAAVRGRNETVPSTAWESTVCSTTKAQRPLRKRMDEEG